MNENPWRNIPAPSAGDLSALRVDPASPHGFYWAKKSDGRISLVLSLSEAHDLSYMLPQLRGIEVTWVPEQRQLQMVLASISDQEIFHNLCEDLVHSASPAIGEADCVQLLLTRLTRWQRLMSKGGLNILDERRIRGLLAELLLLRDEFIPRYGPASIRCWRGPDGYPQDFSINDVNIEVKAHLSGSLPEIEISSIDQLWVDHGLLFLRVQHLSASPESGESLPDVVGEISRLLENDSDAISEFEERLAAVGYIDLQIYRRYRYLQGPATCFLVDQDFPRLDPKNSPKGVERVRYALNLGDCSKYSSAIQWPMKDARND
jgi:hypothetical protein